MSKQSERDLGPIQLVDAKIPYRLALKFHVLRPQICRNPRSAVARTYVGVAELREWNLTDFGG